MCFGPFRKKDEAEKLFNEARRYADLSKKEFDLDRAIRLLEEAVMLKPDREKYRKELDRIREMKARRATSSTSKYPTPKDVYLYLLPKLEAEGGDFVHFETPLPKGDSVGWVQIAFEEQTLVVFCYPYDEDPKQLIYQKGISFPGGYALEIWEGQDYAQFDGPRCPHLELADTIDALFTKLMGTPPSYVVEGWMS